MFRHYNFIRIAHKSSVADKLACKPQEWLFEVVVGFGRDVVVLKILLSVESDGLGFDFTLLHVDLVASQDDRYVLADTNKITSGGGQLKSVLCWEYKHTVPVRNVLVGDARRNIKHDDTAVTIDIVAIPQTSEFLLSSSIPDVEDYLSQVLHAQISGLILHRLSEAVC